MVDAFLGVDGERRRLLLVKGAQRLKTAASLLHGHAVPFKKTDQVDAGLEVIQLLAGQSVNSCRFGRVFCSERVPFPNKPDAGRGIG